MGYEGRMLGVTLVVGQLHWTQEALKTIGLNLLYTVKETGPKFSCRFKF
jgi:hypothetical protein